MQIKDYKDGKLITLSTSLDSRAKLLIFFNFLVFLFGACAFLYMSLTMRDNIPALSITILATIAFFIGAYRCANKCFLSEKIFINKNELQLVYHGFLNKKILSFQTNKISNFRHLDKPELSEHPLAGKTFDNMGFDTEQKVVNEIHGDKRVAFTYEGKTITFGDGVYSWDFETLEILLYDITGNDFRYDDVFEKTIPRSKPDDEPKQS